MTPPPPSAAFAHQAAKGSWVSAVIVLILVAFGEPIGAKVLIEFIALFLMAVGLALGVIALFGIRKHGTKGILGPASVGIILNGLLLFIFLTNFFAARARAKRHTSTAASPVAGVGADHLTRLAEYEMNRRAGQVEGSRYFVNGCCIKRWSSVVGVGRSAL